jgi:hypothetical protein
MSLTPSTVLVINILMMEMKFNFRIMIDDLFDVLKLSIIRIVTLTIQYF